MVNDLRIHTDSRKTSVLLLLDLSAAFDTVDYNLLLNHLVHRVSLTAPVIRWLRSYLEDRSCYVFIGTCTSAPAPLSCGGPLGSILRPLLLHFYMLPIGQIIENNLLSYHTYADDTQIYLAQSREDYSPLKSISINVLEKLDVSNLPTAYQ